MTHEIDADGVGVETEATFLDRHGNRYTVKDRRLIAELQQFIGQPVNNALLVQMEDVVKNHIYRSWVENQGTASATNNGIWGGWTDTTAGSSATMTIECGTGSNVWYNWYLDGAGNTIRTSGGTADTTWHTWVDTDVIRNPGIPPRQLQAVIPPVETEEERARRVIREQERRERWAAERAAREQKLEAARIQAESLLDFVLSDLQRQTFKEEDWFLVVGKSGKIYRIRRGMAGNIDLVGPDGKIIQKYCVHPTENMPVADHMVAQKLWLEHDDEFVEKTANKSAPYRDEVIDLKKYLPAVKKAA